MSIFNRSKTRYFVFVLAMIFVITLSIFVNAGDKIEIHFIDVGQGDSIFIKLPNEENMLIDAGNNGDGDLVVEYLKTRGLDRVDYLIGTHPHEDHIGGLDSVIKNFNIGQVYMPGVSHTTRTFEDVLLAVKEKGLKINTAKAGVSIIENERLKIHFISPVKDNYGELNHWSAVVKIQYGHNSFLFTGDAEKNNEEEMLTTPGRLNADLIKIGHHGSESSTTEAFLEDLKPLYGVITVGADNRYGHPSNSVLNRLQRHGVKIYRTDKQGTIIASSDGENITFDKKPLALNSNRKKQRTGIQIINVSLDDEVVEVKNYEDKPVNISGWRLLSVTAGQEFYFPQGTVLKPGGTVKVVSGRKAKPGPDTIVWSRAYIWNNDGDPAVLYDQSANKISILDS